MHINTLISVDSPPDTASCLFITDAALCAFYVYISFNLDEECKNSRCKFFWQ
jgi:hypothetical protein